MNDELLAEGMSEPAVAKLTEPTGVRWWCSGCQSMHAVPLLPGNPNGWRFNGSLTRPTLDPSVLVYSREKLTPEGEALIDAGRSDELTDEHRTETPRCHSFIRDGWIEYLSDCTHALTGQKVPMSHIALEDR